MTGVKANNKPFTIAIIGGGFTGTMTAVQLMRKHVDYPLRIVLIERGERLAKGVAYGTMCPLHLLNVPAKDMSAFPDEPDHFYKWAKSQDPSVSSATFVPRMRFGVYLEQTLNAELSHLPKNVEFRRIHNEVVGIDVVDDKQALIKFDNKEELAANRVVLAIGNLSPANVRIANNNFYKSSYYVRDPWSPNSIANLNPNEPVLLIGTGLTMVDKALELKLCGFKSTVYALSRHGFLPNVHQLDLVRLAIPYEAGSLPGTALAAFKHMKLEARKAIQEGRLNWRQVVDSVRPVTQEMWKQWSEREKRQFIRHLRCFWDVHRHRIAPEVGAMIDTMLKSGQLKIIAGRLINIEENDDKASVSFRGRNQNNTSYLTVQRVINCTGADSNVKTIDEPLIAYLRDRGILTSDAFGLGPNQNEVGALIDAHNHTSNIIYAVGPLRKGYLWESIAVPELRVQAKELSDYLIASHDLVTV